ncbi:hypothetical protein BTA51_26085 [Hahella sp. CCB-MM4]|uniref:non-ribosomal peptide synthetase n=1 Tax=Hahella sp. (strain CCB-MM4) TaxID=1926491 RepID=UPI000B9A5DAF|nr:non-ribosomal peptide synthetase [Hahella sp. CCB-MM4]OZG70441.1 hypothetical protein BTA51_26085 [Hahella sp. CCB-MM4]
MNGVVDFYHQLLKLGVRLQVEDGNLRIKASKGVVDEHLKEQLRHYKSDLIAFISGKLESYPASEGQKRLWLLQQYNASDAYHIAFGLKLTGHLDTQRLCDAINQEIGSHPALRTRLIETDDGLAQKIGKSAPEIIAEEAKSGSVTEWLRELSETPFDLSNDAPIRAKFIRMNDAEHIILLVVHHTAADGWSLGVMLKNISQRYRGGEIHGKDVPFIIPEVSTPEAEKWWSELLTDEPEPLEFQPSDLYNRPSASTTLSFESSLWHQLNRTAEQSGIGLQHWLNACFNIVLGKLYQRDDVVLLTPYANRNRSDDFYRVGFLANTLFSRAKLTPSTTVRELSRALSEQSQIGIQHSHASYEKLVRQHSDCVSSVMFSYEGEPGDHLCLEGVSIDLIRYMPSQSKFDLLLTVIPGINPKALFEYDKNALHFDEVERIKQSFKHVIQLVVQEPDLALGKIALSEQDSSDELTARPELALRRIQEQVRIKPLAIAAVQGETHWTYNQLWESVGQVHHWLKQRGVSRGSIVGIAMGPGLDWLASALAIWSVGAAYVPIDETMPQARKAMMIQEACLDMVLDRDNYPIGECGRDGGLGIQDNDGGIQNSGEGIRHSDKEIPDRGEGIQNWTPEELTPLDPAWLIFTSGSTGKPKAAVVPHGGVARLLDWYQKSCVDSETITLVISNPSFDLTQKNLFTPLISGGRVVFPAMAQFDTREVLDAIQRHRATLVNCTPTVFNALLKEARNSGYQELDFLSHVVLGGEPISVNPLRQWQQHRPTQCEFINSYGPTECSDVVAWHRLNSDLSKQSEPVAIGQAIPGTRLTVVDHHGQPLPAGATGELMIDGDSVGLGYLRHDQLTAKAFLEDGSGFTGKRYLTGDRAVLGHDGLIYYLGRRDTQIKLNGYRIEAGEVETAIMDTGVVDSCAVVVRQDAQQNKILVAYYNSQHSETNEDVLRESIKPHLPHYYVPSRFISLSEMPLTRSGKVDRNRLPVELPLIQSLDNKNEKGLSEEFSETERAIAKIWQELLAHPVTQRDDNFFALGGHSLLAMDMVRQIRQDLNIPARVTQVVTAPRLKDFAALIAQQGGQSELDSVSQTDMFALNKLSAMQKRLWFLWHKDGASSDYLMSATWRIDGELDVERLKTSFTRVVSRHPILSSRLVEMDSGVYYQLDQDEPLVQFEEYQADESSFISIQQRLYTTPIDLGKDRFIRISLIQTNAHCHYLVVNLHHIAADGLSLPIFISELKSAWNNESSLEPAPQFAQISQQREADYPKLRQHWQHILSDAPQMSVFPVDNLPTTSAEQEIAGHQPLMLPAEAWGAVKRLAQQLGLTPFSILLSSWAILLHRYSHEEDLVFGVPVALRDDSDSARVIGPLLNTVPVRMGISSDIQVKEAIIRGGNAFRNAQIGADLPFEEIVDAVNPVRNASIPPLFQIQIVEDPCSLGSLALDGLTVVPCDHMAQQAKYDFNIHFQTGSLDLQGYISFKETVYGNQTVKWIAKCWQNLIQEMLDKPDCLIGEMSLISKNDYQTIRALSGHDAPEYHTDKTLHGLFVHQARKTPDAPALVWDTGYMSYRELDKWSNQVACGLVQKGLNPGDRICIQMPASAARIAVLYGVLKAGGVYVPIDPQWPEERQQLILDRVQPKLCIQERDVNSLTEGQSTDPLPIGVSPEQNCYVMFTSGSTGTPKGVPIKHGGVTHDLAYLIQWLGLGATHRIIQLTSFSFDPSVRDLFATLGCGACAVLIDDDAAKTPSRILNAFRTHRVTHVLSMVPTMLRALMVEGSDSVESDSIESDNVHLNVLMLNGERLRGEDVRGAKELFGDDVKIVNQYGPTEATMTSATHVVGTNDEAETTVPLGRPNPNTLILIMDKNGQILPPGAIGEICIAGPGLSDGYLGQSSQAFTWQLMPDGRRTRFYRTGDLGRWRCDGVLSFLGRMDFQVKLRGNRIELGEIDAHLGQLSGIKNAAVSVVEHQGNPVLVAWIEESSPGSFDPVAAKQILSIKLPSYMVPAVFSVVEVLPLTASGKVDRRRLPDSLQVDPTTKTVASTELEVTLSNLWSQLLGLSIPPDCDTNFFELGANSLMMVQASERLSQLLPIPIAVVDLFEYPNIRALSRFIETSTKPKQQTQAPQQRSNHRNRRREALSEARRKRAVSNTRKSVHE